MESQPRDMIELGSIHQVFISLCLHSSDDKMPSLYYWHSTFKWQRAALSSDRVMKSHKRGDRIRMLTRLKPAHDKESPFDSGMSQKGKTGLQTSPLGPLLQHCVIYWEPAVYWSIHSLPSFKVRLKTPFHPESILCIHFCSGLMIIYTWLPGTC